MPTYTIRSKADGRVWKGEAANPQEAVAKAQEYFAASTNLNVPRMAGLGARAVGEGLIEGAGTLASLPADAAYNVGAGAYNLGQYLGGGEGRMEYGMPVTGMVTRAADAAGDALGLPEPETENERLAAAAIKGGVAFLPGMGAGRVISSIKGLDKVGDALRAAPATQAAAGTAAGVGTEYAAQQGASPGLAAAAGLAAGGSTALGMGAASTARSVVRPWTRSGREQIVGDVLNMQAHDAPTAIFNLESSAPTVPGSRPMAGVASRDLGLIATQRNAERLDTRRLMGARVEEQNTARQDLLRRYSATETQADAMRQARTAKADIDTAALFDTPEMRATQIPTRGSLLAIAAARQDKRSFERTPVREVLSWARNRLIRASRRDPQTKELTINPGVLYSIRQDMADLMKGKLQTIDAPNGRLARRELGGVVQAIDQEIEAIAPGYLAYMDDLRQSGQAIGQKRAAGEVLERASSKGPTSVTSDEPFLSLATLKNTYQQRAAEMSPSQRRAFEVVIKDLDLAMKTTTPSARSAGSDTLQNMSIAAAMARFAGGGAMDNAVGEGITSFLTGLNSRLGGGRSMAVNDLLVEAMLEPRIAAALMRKATPGNIQYANSIINQVAQGGRAATQAATAGAIPEITITEGYAR